MAKPVSRRTALAYLGATIASLSLASACSTPSGAQPKPTAVTFPEKGRAIQIIVPFTAGGATDVATRLLAKELEPILGTSIEVVNKPGAGAQVGLTEFTQAKPDGYTLGAANLPGPITIALNPDRKASFSRKDFKPIGIHVVDPGAIAVAASSPYKSIADLVEAARAKPGQVKAGTTGLMSDDHFAIIAVEKAANVEFAIVHFDGGSQREAELLGGKIDASFGNVGSFLPLVKSNQLRIIAIMDEQEAELAPGVPTLRSQGYDVIAASARGIFAPGQTPQPIVDILANAMKQVATKPDYQQKLKDLGATPRYMDPQQVEAYWTDVETRIKPILEQALAESKR
ncbi:MAG TPA: tripartite tricarboxylate transporter substrate binding protein [Chloroflexota bacterium]